MRRRVVLGAAAVPLALGAALRPAAAQAPAGKTYALVHGAWGGGWIRRPVADGLRAKGHRVFTPTQTGLGERRHLLSRDITLDTFVADIAGVLEAEELTDVILIGHSFGGSAVSGVADRVGERIRHLVYLDALLPENGRNAFSVLPQGIEADRRRQVAEQGGGAPCRCRRRAPSRCRRRRAPGSPAASRRIPSAPTTAPCGWRTRSATAGR
jgi:pimeloyl-ACP methyl ester carboxylesterase